MGQAQSSQTIKNETVNKIFKKNLTEISNETSTKAKCSASSTQEIDIEIFHSKPGCNIDASQKAEVNVTCLQTVKNEVNNEALTKIQNDLRAAAESELDNMTSGFAVPPGGVNSRQDILNKIENTIESDTKTVIKNAFDNTLVANADGTQGFKLKIGICEAPITIDQDQIVKLVAEQSTDNLIKNIAKDISLNKLETENKSTGKNVTKGGDAVLMDMVGGIFSGLMSMWLIIPVIVIVIIIGLVVVMSGGGESPAPPANSSSPDLAALLAKAATKGKGGSKMKIGKKYGKGMKAKKLKW